MACLELIVNGLDILDDLGFKMRKYGDDPKDVDYILKTKDYTITVDPWFDVYLERNDSEHIQIKIDITERLDLENLIDFCKE